MGEEGQPVVVLFRTKLEIPPEVLEELFPLKKE